MITVSESGGAISLEFMPIREGVARGFLRQSPRNPKFASDSIALLISELERRPYSRILVQDTRKNLVRRIMKSAGWGIGPAVPSTLRNKCSAVTTYDLPMDEKLVDSNGTKPDLSNTSSLSGISVDVGPRKAWAFFTEEGDQARVISESERKQGFLVASASEDLFTVADCLVRYLASMRKSWAVFSVDMGRFIRQFDPQTMFRMSLDAPKGFDHHALPLSSENRGAAVRLFSEYYDESLFQSRLRLRKFNADKNYTMHLVDGGFVITKLEGDSGLIYDIYVTPSRQGRGLGAELMRCALTDFVGRVSSCYLHTSYPRAKSLYEKFGFKTVYAQLGIRLDELALERPSAK